MFAGVAGEVITEPGQKWTLQRVATVYNSNHAFKIKTLVIWFHFEDVLATAKRAMKLPAKDVMIVVLL